MPNLPFLQKIVEDIQLEGNDLGCLKDHCYIFPTRRAGVYFKKYLTQRFKGKKFWSPYVLSIVEFIELHTSRVILNPVTLVFELYNIYKNYEPTVKFDTFYPWGQIILKDFDDIDKYMVDAAKLFTNLKDIKDIEEKFALTKEQLAFLEQFWVVLKKPKNSEVEEDFIRIWEVLGKVYADFQESLAQNHAAYEGLAQRIVLENLREGRLTLPYSKIVWAGFNALTTAEKGIVEFISEHYNTTVYWDTDDYYMQTRSPQEAGTFARRYFEIWKNHPAHNWTAKTDFVQNYLTIHTIGVPLRVGQAKYVGEVLEKLIKERSISLPDSAVVLGDEGMLFPMLYAIPPNVEAVNITMGYPLRDTPLYKLLETIVQLQNTRQDPSLKPSDDTQTAKESEITDDEPDQETEKEKYTQKIYLPEQVTLFYSKFVLQLLQNPFIKQFNNNGIEGFIKYINKYNLIYIYNFKIAKEITSNVAKESTSEKESKKETEERFPAILKTLFSKADDFLQLIAIFKEVLNALYSHIKDKKNLAEKENENLKTQEVDPEDLTANQDTPEFMEMEFIYHLLLNLNVLEETLLKYRQLISIDTFWKIFREIIQTVTLPFTGEPLRGLQIMGFLETRTLDFDNLFVLGLNEGIIPSSKSNMTFIPFNLRRGFHLPTFLDQDSIFAYHFYHLLQRSKNVYLFYNTEVSGMGGGDKSRYLLQLEQELSLIPNKKVTIHNYIVSTPLVLTKERNLISVPKSEAVMEKLNRYLFHGTSSGNATQAKLSPTALSTYINCPVQFYLKYVAQLYEIQNLNEEINNLIFGNVLHKTIELLYQPYIDNNITSDIIHLLLNNELLISRALNRAFKDNQFSHHTEGKNLLMKRILKRLVIKVLENDLQDTPLKIVGLETKDYTHVLPIGNGKEVVISGSIDRLDKILLPDGEAFRILDYKTGNVTLQRANALKSDLSTYLDGYFTNPDLKTGFQAYLYAYLFWVQQNRNVRLKVGIYALKKMNEGIVYLRNGELISNELLMAFENHLINLLQNLFNKEESFVQTDDIKRYTYSPYQGLVGLF